MFHSIASLVQMRERHINVGLTRTRMKEGESSVTRWLDYLFNIGPFKTTKICPIVLEKFPNWVRNLSNTK